MEPALREKSRWFRGNDRRQQLDSIHDLLVRIDAALVVRDPGSARSVDAYDGLRKQIVAAAGERRRMLVMLSEVAESLRQAQSLETLSSKVDEWMLQANLVQLEAAVDVEDAFDIVGGGSS